MSFQWKTAVGVMVFMAMANVGEAFPAEAPKPVRLPSQQHNRMVCIRVEGKDDLFVNMPDHYDLGSASISPDGQMIAFDAMTVGEQPVRQSWIVGVDGKGLRKLADAAVPRWSPDAKRLLVTSNVLPTDSNPWPSQFLIELELAGGKERKICTGRFGDWSPDGKRIALARGGERTSNSGVYPESTLVVANADGGEAKELGAGDWPSWSPDGKKIAYCLSEQGPPPMLWMVDLETMKRDRLGVGFYRAHWAADGKSVVSNGLVLAEDTRPHRMPARFWVDGNRIEFFLLNYDTPFSPSVSRDGKMVVFIVDSEAQKRPAR